MRLRSPGCRPIRPSIRSTPPGSQVIPGRCAQPRSGRVRRAADHREIAPLEVVRGELRRQPLVRRVGLGDDQQPRGVLVDPVHDARPEPPADARQRAAAMVQQRVHQRPVGRARRRMHHQPGGLVDDDEVGVLVDDVERDRLGRGARSPPAPAASPPPRSRAPGAAAGRPARSRPRPPRRPRRISACSRERLSARPSGTAAANALSRRSPGAGPSVTRSSAKRLGHGRQSIPGDEDYPEPRRLRQLRRLVTVLTVTLIVGVITIVALLVIRLAPVEPVADASGRGAHPCRRERAGGDARQRLDRRRHRRRRRARAHPRARPRHRRRARGTEIAPAE